MAPFFPLNNRNAFTISLHHFFLFQNCAKKIIFFSFLLKIITNIFFFFMNSKKYFSKHIRFSSISYSSNSNKHKTISQNIIKIQYHIIYHTNCKCNELVSTFQDNVAQYYSRIIESKTRFDGHHYLFFSNSQSTKLFRLKIQQKKLHKRYK